MSEAIKLKTLLNKTKPSIQFEVRKKKPTSTVEFREYARVVKELLQLYLVSLIKILTTLCRLHSPIKEFSLLINTPSSVNINAINNFLTNSSQRYSRDFNHNYPTYHNRDCRGN